MPAEHLLVVVADDGGIDEARNRGILAALARGAACCTSVLANTGAFDDIAAGLRGLPDAGVGLHLNLTEGRPLTGDVPGLTAAGRFLGDKHEVWRRALRGDVDPGGVRREALAQLERLGDAGLTPTHVDGHQHVHLLPGVRDGLAAALGEHPEVTWVRLPRPVFDPAAAPCETGPRLADERVGAAWREIARAGRRTEAALGTLADEAVALRRGRRSADAFLGVDLMSSFSTEALLRRLCAVTATVSAPAPWVVEVMTHPGECDPASVGFSALPGRSAETQALCDPELPARLAGIGFRLGRFGDAAPRSAAP